MGCRRQGLGRARVEGSAARSVRGRGGKGPAGTRPKGPQGRHSLPRLLPTCSRFPLTCPRGQWSSLLAQRLARFRPSDPTVMCTGASRTTASRLFASGARARRTLRTAAQGQPRSGAPGPGSSGTVQGYVVVVVSTPWCAVQVTVLSAPVSCRVERTEPSLCLSPGEASPRPPPTCAPHPTPGES